MHWIFDGPEMPQSAISLDIPWHSNSNFFSGNCFIFWSRFQSMSFYWSCDIRVEISWLVFSASWVDSWLVKIGKSALDTELFRFSAHPSRKLQLWMLLSSSELTYLLFWFLDYSFIEQLNFKFKTSLLEFNVRSQNWGFAKKRKKCWISSILQLTFLQKTRLLSFILATIVYILLIQESSIEKFLALVLALESW